MSTYPSPHAAGSGQLDLDSRAQECADFESGGQERDCLNPFLQCKIIEIRNSLNAQDRLPFWRSWMRPDERVRIKHMHKIGAALQDILLSDTNGHGAKLAPGDTALACLLAQIGDPYRLSPGNARELADLLEIEALRRSTPERLRVLAQAHNTGEKGTAVTWTRYFASTELADVLAGKCDPYAPSFCEAMVETARLEMAESRRRDTESKLRSSYLSMLGAVLSCAMLVAGLFYSVTTVLLDHIPTGLALAVATAGQLARAAVPIDLILFVLATQAAQWRPALENFGLVLLVIAAGALGSVLSRAIKLSRSLPPLNNPPGGGSSASSAQGPGANPTQDAPEGIPALLADQAAFFAQVAIGGASGFVLFLILSSGLIPELKQMTVGAARLASFAFVAGFSEAYFLGIVDKIAGDG